ncbi:MAG: T9SS type A sorting domain-containing protein [Chitinophagales bacterium]|nr:T9SS type A sorting domain-containing protein [Chitinophagales bacterium]MCB9031324.1 T9SS type A sorting domain-containing protein [Chitinophagales bacterium]HQU39597.1 T9SS type A sorting domain-containing protein [Chitinophagales bacterium]
MGKYLSLCILLVVFTATTAQTPEILWQLNVGGDDWDELRSMEETADGGVIMGGFSYSGISGDKTEDKMGAVDFWIIKVNSSGAIEWQQTIGGDDADQCYFVQQTSDLGYICGGWSRSGVSYDKTVASFGERDCWLLKLDTDGEIVWQQAYGGDQDDYLFAFDNTADGGYVLGCFSASGISGNKTEPNYGYNDYWVIKTDSIGNIEWQNTIEGYGDDRLHGIRQTADGGYVMGGTSDSPMGGDKSEDVFGEEDYWVIKLDTTGQIEWENNIGGVGEDEQFSIIQTQDGGYFLGGFSTSPVSGDKTEDAIGVQDFWTVKLSADGEIEWQNTIGGDSGDRLEYVLQNQSSKYFLGGASLSGISGDKESTSFGFWDFWAIQLNESGEIEWQLAIGGDGDDVTRGINQTSDGGTVIGGQSSSGISGNKTVPNQGGYDFYLVKLGCNNGLYRDLDGDGYGDPEQPMVSCEWSYGLAYNNTDCDDQNNFVNPGMIEVANGIDDNCNGIIDDLPSALSDIPQFVQVYPNPFGTYVQVISENISEPLEYVSITDLSGKVVLQQAAYGQLTWLETAHIPTGIYVLQWISAHHENKVVLIRY